MAGNSPEDLRRRLDLGREVLLRQRAERAIQDPKRLRYAALMFRCALARGWVDRDGHVLDQQAQRRERAADAL